MRTLLKIALCAIVAPLLAGCAEASVAIMGVNEFSGPQALYAEIKPVSSSPNAKPLGRYNRVEVAAFQDDFGGRTPLELLSYIPLEIKRRLADLCVPYSPKGQTLLISGQILYYEDQSLGRVLISPLEEVIARVELTDKETGEIIGVAICISRVTARTQAEAVRSRLKAVNAKSAAMTKAAGLAEAIDDWIRSRYPEDED